MLHFKISLKFPCVAEGEADVDEKLELQIYTGLTFEYPSLFNTSYRNPVFNALRSGF